MFCLTNNFAYPLPKRSLQWDSTASSRQNVMAPGAALAETGEFAGAQCSTSAQLVPTEQRMA